ncbi:AAA family ATPase [Spirosoma sp. KNUC1025]|uniref:AAA family ATPase n=1 Tax=Spirosoma sp. KNUC1025 TaxID=2894082 RepID=UPI00386A18A6|nr:AAA family ATPase [Spirosoma sp. KNUC1025]
MKIKRLVIENFKSIERIELIEPNPFTVFVGPNGSGKSNIFEALEFVNLKHKISDAFRLFGGMASLLRRQSNSKTFFFECDFGNYKIHEKDTYTRTSQGTTLILRGVANRYDPENNQPNNQFEDNFIRLFVGKEKLRKLSFNDDQRLAFDGSNLEKVLKRVLSVNTLREEIFEWLELFVPEFKAVEVDDRDELHWFEESTSEYFTKDLISDGTYNILALLTAVYQSKEPQFLCIEEPENGLHPDVIKEFVNLCRYACEKSNHYIWLNTHSQTLASQLTADEIVVVDKIKGATQTKQFKGRDFHGLRMDEAWLMNALGGGLPW